MVLRTEAVLVDEVLTSKGIMLVSVSMLREYVNDNKLEVRKWPRDRKLADELVKPTKCELLQSLFRIEST